MKSVRHIYSLLLILMLTGMGCGDDNNGNPLGSGSSTNKPGVPPEPGIGYGVSGLLFNNNLVLYDRARSDLSSFELVLIPQMYFTSIDESEFPIHGTFPRGQIVSGGVKIDDIPAITDPEMVSPGEIDYVQENELVIGMTINGESRAYPHNMLWWHEIINDEIGGKRISVTFCPLTGSGLVFDASMARDRLEMIPAIETSFARWKEMHPDTRVVSSSNSRLTSTALSATLTEITGVSTRDRWSISRSIRSFRPNGWCMVFSSARPRGHIFTAVLTRRTRSTTGLLIPISWLCSIGKAGWPFPMTAM